jgi:hypothetical protein
VQTISKQVITVKKVVDPHSGLKYTLQIARFADGPCISRVDRLTLPYGSRNLVARCINHYIEGIMKAAAEEYGITIGEAPDLLSYAEELEELLEKAAQRGPGSRIKGAAWEGEMSRNDLFMLGRTFTFFIEGSTSADGCFGLDGPIAVILTYEGEEPPRWGQPPFGHFANWGEPNSEYDCALCAEGSGEPEAYRVNWGDHWEGPSEEMWAGYCELFPSMTPQDRLS